MTTNTADELRAKVALLKARIQLSHDRLNKATGDTFTPPEGVRSAAARGLELRAKWKRGGITNSEASAQGIGSGVQRATNLKNGDAISLMTIRRMRAFFSRHEKNYAPDKKMPDGGPTAGTIAWLLWGGNAGRDWADSVLSRVEKMGPTPSAVHAPTTETRKGDAKAPPEDRVHGSDKNPKGSASSAGGDIEVTEAIVAALNTKVESNNEKAREDWQKATLGMLKAVYRRGAGAYSTSHRPGVSRGAWAMARVNAYLRLLRSGRPENAAYVSDNDLLPSGHPKAK